MNNHIAWALIGLAAIVSLFLPWPVMIIVGLIALSRFRGPDHYTKFAVPTPYRFKFDVTWILLLLFGLPSWFMVFAWVKAGAEISGGWALIAAITGFIALLRTVVWLCFRFPLTSWFLAVFTGSVTGVRRGRHWW